MSTKDNLIWIIICKIRHQFFIDWLILLICETQMIFYLSICLMKQMWAAIWIVVCLQGFVAYGCAVFNAMAMPFVVAKDGVCETKAWVICGSTLCTSLGKLNVNPTAMTFLIPTKTTTMDCPPSWEGHLSTSPSKRKSSMISQAIMLSMLCDFLFFFFSFFFPQEFKLWCTPSVW